MAESSTSSTSENSTPTAAATTIVLADIHPPDLMPLGLIMTMGRKAPLADLQAATTEHSSILNKTTDSLRELQGLLLVLQAADPSQTRKPDGATPTHDEMVQYTTHLQDALKQHQHNVTQLQKRLVLLQQLVITKQQDDMPQEGFQSKRDTSDTISTGTSSDGNNAMAVWTGKTAFDFRNTSVAMAVPERATTRTRRISCAILCHKSTYAAHRSTPSGATIWQKCLSKPLTTSESRTPSFWTSTIS